MLPINHAFLRVYQSETGVAEGDDDFDIPNDRIEAVDFDRHINRQKDDGSITIYNDDGRYSGRTQEIITMGDRIDVFVGTNSGIESWGADTWATGAWGGYARLWSAFVQDTEYTRHSANESTLSLNCTDWVFEVMSNRRVYDAYENQPIAGSDGAILDSALARYAPEIDRAFIDSVDEETSIVCNGMSLLDLAIDLAERANCLLRDIGDRIVFTPVQDTSPAFTVDPAQDMGTFTHSYDSTDVVNVVQVEGGTDHAIDDEQLSRTAFTTVGGSDRVMFRVDTRKSQLDRIELWTRKNQDSSDSLEVRLQKDDGGQPVAPDDSDSDIDRKRLDSNFIAHNGFTTFLLNDHTLPEPRPWVIVQAEGSDGHDIGTDSDGNPAYKAHFQFNVAIVSEDRASISQHTRVEDRIQKDSIGTINEARAVANATLAHHAEPESEVQFDVPGGGERMHFVDPGTNLRFDLTRERVLGEYIVTEVSQALEHNRLDTAIQARDIDTI